MDLPEYYFDAEQLANAGIEVDRVRAADKATWPPIYRDIAESAGYDPLNPFRRLMDSVDLVPIQLAMWRSPMRVRLIPLRDQSSWTLLGDVFKDANLTIAYRRCLTTEEEQDAQDRTT